MPFKTLFFTTASLSLLTLDPAHALSTDAKEIIGKTAVEYLKANPNAFAEIIQAAQEQGQKEVEEEQAVQIEKYSDDLFNTKDGTPFLGNPHGTTEVVVFMDPFCHYCRQFETTLRDAVKANKDLKIVGRDIAIMHEKSLMLIKAAVAASYQGKYSEMQSAIHQVEPSVTEEDLLKMATDFKLDVEKFTADMKSTETEKLIKDNMDLANNLTVAATPTFIIKQSKKFIAGYQSLEDFQGLLKG